MNERANDKSPNTAPPSSAYQSPPNISANVNTVGKLKIAGFTGKKLPTTVSSISDTKISAMNVAIYAMRLDFFIFSPFD